MDKRTSSVLFISLPDGGTRSVRDLPSTLTLVDLEEKLELLTGYPSKTYNLHYGKEMLLLDKEAIFEIFQNGAVLRMSLRPEVEELSRHLMSSDLDGLMSLCQYGLDKTEFESSKDDTGLVDIQMLFFAAYRCAFEGFLDILNSVLKIATSKLLTSRTIHGRSLAHAAAAADKPNVLQQILLHSHKHQLPALPGDQFNKTPYDIATMYDATLCERLIRNFKHSIRNGSINKVVQQLSAVKLKENFGKRRVKSALVRGIHFATNQELASGVMGKSTDGNSVSSGYQTQENIPEKVSTDDADFNHSKARLTSATKPKKVKFKTRIKSAPPHLRVESHGSVDKRLAHDKCYRGKPFLAYRDVPFEELRPESVEFVELDRKNIIGMDARNREKSVMSMLSSGIGTQNSSLNNSIQDLNDDLNSLSPTEPDGAGTPQYEWYQSKGHFIQDSDPRKYMMENMQALRRRFTYPKTATSKRAQSAGYYRAQYHIRSAQEEYDKEIPPPRPATANSKYRAWKPWLLQLYEEQAKNKAKEQQNAEKKKQNLEAFKRWLKKKQEEEEETSDTDESDDDPYYSEGETYDQWMKRKKPAFEKLDKKTLAKRRGHVDKRDLAGNNVTIYELCSTEGTSMKTDNTDSYMYAYQKWQRRKRKYEAWKLKQGGKVEDPTELSKKDLTDIRMALYCNGFTYNEWLGQLNRENVANKKKVKFTS